MQVQIDGQTVELSSEQATFLEGLRQDAAVSALDEEIEELEAEIEELEDEIDELEFEEEDGGDRDDSADWQDRAITAEARLAVAEALLNADSADDEDFEDDDDFDDEEFEVYDEDSFDALVEAQVAERTDSIVEAANLYREALPFLPQEFKFDSETTAHQLRAEALMHSQPRLDSSESFNWDSEEGVKAAYEQMKVYRVSSHADSLEDLFQRSDMLPAAGSDGGGKKMKVRKRRPDYTPQ